MRVLQFGRFWNDQHGGIERHVALLSRQLAVEGVDVVNLVAADHVKGSDIVVDGYRLVQAPSHGRVASVAISPELVLKALSLHRAQPFDIVHLHLPDPLSHVTSLLMPKGAKRVVTWHSDVIRQKRMLALYMPFVRRLLTGADALVAATPAHYTSSTQIPAEIPESRKHVIPYGLDFEELQLKGAALPVFDEIKRRAAGRPVLFALGRHVYYKGFDVLIDAMKQIDALLVIGSDGPLRPQLEAQTADAGLGDKVWFAGRIPEDELPAYFNACDIFCLPSVAPSEAFGLVQLEAMACGKPVVCTQLNNGVNVVHRDGITGIAVPVRDADALAGAVNRLIGDVPLRERMGRQAREHALSEYSLASSGKRHLALYQDLLSASR